MDVLLGVSGADPVASVIEQALARARGAGADLTVAVLDAPDQEPSLTETERRVEEALESAGADAAVGILEGHPGSRLVEYADDGGFDELVIHGGSRSPLGKIQLGSTAEFVILNARTTVTLLR